MLLSCCESLCNYCKQARPHRAVQKAAWCLLKDKHCFSRWRVVSQNPQSFCLRNYLNCGFFTDFYLDQPHLQSLFNFKHIYLWASGMSFLVKILIKTVGFSWSIWDVEELLWPPPRGADMEEDEHASTTGPAITAWVIMRWRRDTIRPTDQQSSCEVIIKQ